MKLVLKVIIAIIILDKVIKIFGLGVVLVMGFTWFISAAYSDSLFVKIIKQIIVIVSYLIGGILLAIAVAAVLWIFGPNIERGMNKSSVAKEYNNIMPGSEIDNICNAIISRLYNAESSISLQELKQLGSFQMKIYGNSVSINKVLGGRQETFINIPLKSYFSNGKNVLSKQEQHLLRYAIVQRMKNDPRVHAIDDGMSYISVIYRSVLG